MIDIFVNGLIFLNKILFNNLGLTIIVLAVVPRLIFHPLLANSLRFSKAMMDLKPKLDEARRKHSKDLKKLMEEQNRIYKQAGVNQTAGMIGCFFSTILQFVVFILLINSLSRVIASGVNSLFLFWDLAKPDIFRIEKVPFPLPGILVILTSALFFVQSKMTLPSSVPAKTKKEPDFSSSFSSQTVFLIPLVILFTGFKFSAGIILYWLVYTIFAIIQQFLVVGPGGLEIWLKKLRIIK